MAIARLEALEAHDGESALHDSIDGAGGVDPGARSAPAVGLEEGPARDCQPMSAQPRSPRNPAQRIDDPEELDDLTDLDTDEDSALSDEAGLDDLHEEEDDEEDEEDEEDDAFEPGDDSDLGLDDLDDEGDESIGLDTSVGFDDGSDEVDLPELDQLEQDDDESAGVADEDWDAEDADALPGLDDDLEDAGLDADEEAEYGYTDDDDDFEEDDALDDDLGDEPRDGGDDGGAEGLEDESDIEELELVQLPVIDLNAEEEIGLPGLDGDYELVGVGLLEEPEPVIEIAPGLIWKMLRPSASRVMRIAWPRGSEVATRGEIERCSLEMHGSSLLLASGGLYRLDGLADSFRELDFELTKQLGEHAGDGAIARALAVTEHEDVMQLAMIVNGRLCLSDDAGESFAVQRSPEVSHIGFTHAAFGPHVWWRTAAGELGSDNGTTVQAPVIAMHADGHRSVAYLERGAPGPCVASSVDGGKTFSRWQLSQLPSLTEPQSAAPRIETCGQALLLSAAGQLLCGMHGGELTPLAPRACAPATLADEESEPFAYACVAHEDRWLIIRRMVRAERAVPTVLAAVSRAELELPLALVVSYGEDGMLSVFVAGAAALLRIEASLDGELS